MENEATLPRPIDNGQVDQTVVEYTGGRRGSMTYRGPSGRQYRFDALPSGKQKYVLREDLEYFARRPEFRILTETRIDAEAKKLRALVAEALEQRAVVGPATDTIVADRDSASEPPSPPQRRGGRPRGRGFGARLDCWMTCGRVGEYYGTAREAYDGYVERPLCIRRGAGAVSVLPPFGCWAGHRGQGMTNDDGVGQGAGQALGAEKARETSPAAEKVEGYGLIRFRRGTEDHKPLLVRLWLALERRGNQPLTTGALEAMPLA